MPDSLRRASCIAIIGLCCCTLSGCGAIDAVKDNPFVIIRWAFNYILTPVAVIAVFYVLVTNIVRIVDEGFKSDDLEGYKRVCTIVLPLAFLAYAVVTTKQETATETQPDSLVETLQSFSPVTRMIASAIAGILVSLEMFQLHDFDNDVLMRMLLLFLASITCLVSYMFIAVTLATGVNVAFGLVIGFCGTAIFLPHKKEP